MGIQGRPRFLILTGLAVLVLAMVSAFFLLARSVTSRSASPAAGHVLRWANEGITDLYTLDPADSPDFNARQAMQLIFGGLVRFGADFKPVPDVAERWTISRDGRTYTFYLRPDARFGDGTRATAQDVIFSLNRALRQQRTDKCGPGAGLLSDIAGSCAVMLGQAQTARGIQMMNRSTVRISLTAPSGSFLAKLANPPGYIVPRRAVLAKPKTWDQKAFGTGPFMVARWVHNNALLLVPNPYYYGGRLQLAGIDMPFIPEPVTAYKRYRAGNVDIMGTVHFPTEALFDVAHHSDFHPSARLETVYLTLNERIAPFNNEKVRLAFAHAVNKDAIVRQVYSDFAHPTDGLMPPGLPGYNPKLRGASYNPALARRLLAEAGFPGGRGLPAITYPVDQDAQAVLLANALAGQWRRVLGVQVRTKQYTHSAYLDLLSRLGYQIAVIDWTQDYPDPQNFLSQQLRTGVPNNNGGWSNATFDHLVDQADRLSGTSGERLQLYRQAEEIAMSQGAVIPLVNPKAGILMRTDVHGLTISGGYILVPDWTRVSVAGGTTG